MKLARFIFPLAIVLVLAAVVYSVLRPALVRGKARQALKELNWEDAYYPPETRYWKIVDEVFGPSHLQIRVIRLVNTPAILEDRDLGFLRSLPELENLALPFQDLSDAFLADVIRNSENLLYLDLAWTHAGEKTVEAILDHPKSLKRVHLVGTAISREDAERLRRAYPNAVSWSPPMAPADRVLWQATRPAVTISTYELDFDLLPYLHIDLGKLERVQEETLGLVTGRFMRIAFSGGILYGPRAQSILRGKETSKLSFTGIKLTDPLWMGSIAHLENLDFHRSTIHLPPPEAGRCMPERVENLVLVRSYNYVGEGGLGRLFQGSRIDRAHLVKYKGESLDLAVFDSLPEVDLGELSVNWDDGPYGKLIRQVARHRTLEGLNFTSQRVGKSGLALIGQMTQLNKLHLGGAGIRGGDLEAIGSLTNLTDLNIGVNIIEDEHLEHLLPLQKLERLSLHNHRGRPGSKLLTDACLPTLAKFPKLRHLNVMESDISDVDGILALPALEDLYENNFTEAERARIRKARPGLVFR